ncbi:MAG TPA: PAS domain-containing protein [Polyangiaceae bacterium]|nr:PAS domain-containing protein [Polyangiaceae bacterium]
MSGANVPPSRPPPAPAPFVETLLRLGRADVDDLPYGLVLLDAAGDILLYNRYEASMSRTPPELVLGKNWFHEVAPCTRVSAFYGRFRAFLTGTEPSVSFWFWFHFLHGSQLVDVVLLRSPEPGQVLMTVTRRLATLPEGASYTMPVALDEEAGALHAPYGSAVAMPPDLLEMGLDALSPGQRRHVGRELGGRLAVATHRLAQHEHGRPLRALETLLAFGLLDRSLAGSGLGRLALDAVSVRGRLGVVVRPPVPAGPSLGEVYEGLIERVASFLAGRPLAAVWLDGSATDRVPWRYELAPPVGSVPPLRLEDGELPPEEPLSAESVGTLFSNAASAHSR